MLKKVMCILIALMMFTSQVCFAVDLREATARADKLKELGLFKGTDNGYELESLSNRAQMAVTIVRLLGKEEKAIYQDNEHPFNDVPKWASPYVGWLYENYLINGLDADTFGTYNEATNIQYVTMLLRVLGYSDENNEDFHGGTSVSFAGQIGLVESWEVNALTYQLLTRQTMVDLAYRALRMPIKNSRRSLAQKLCDDRILDENTVKKVGIPIGIDPEEAFADIPEVYGKINLERKGSRTIVCTFDNPIEEYALRVYYSTNGAPFVEIPRDDESSPVRFSYGKINYQGKTGYLSRLDIYGIPKDGKTYSFIVLKTSSTGAVYDIFGKTSVAAIR